MRIAGRESWSEVLFDSSILLKDRREAWDCSIIFLSAMGERLNECDDMLPGDSTSTLIGLDVSGNCCGGEEAEELKELEVRALDPTVPLDGLVLLGLGPPAIWFFVDQSPEETAHSEQRSGCADRKAEDQKRAGPRAEE
jgi:hypothetical protein